jgi:anti-sigma-K factor RskA
MPEPLGRARRGWAAALSLVAVVAVIALVLTFAFMRQRAGERTPDLLTLAASRAAGATVAVRTDDPDIAHQFILDQFGWPLDVPDLQLASLMGVGVDPLAPGVELPFLRYRTPAGSAVTVYAFDYAFLDAAARQVQLAPAVYARLSAPQSLDVRRQGDSYLVMWRRRAAIYAAVTDDADAAGRLADEVRSDETSVEAGLLQEG